MRTVTAKNSALKYYRIPVSDLTLPPGVKRFLEENVKVFKAGRAYLKGGAARGAFLAWALKQLHNIDVPVKEPRDWDILYIADRDKGEYITIDEIKDMFNTRVYRRDITREPNLDTNFRGADVGLNNVVLNHKELTYTAKALRDVKKLVVSPAGKEFLEKRIKGGPGGAARLSMRALMLSLEHGMKLNERLIEPLAHASGRELLVILLKCYEKKVAEPFWEQLRKAGNEYVLKTSTPEELLLLLVKKVQDWEFKFDFFPIHHEIIKAAKQKEYERKHKKAVKAATGTRTR